jgi:phospholipase C
MPNLNRIQIVFRTHDDPKDEHTVLHVFIKNRRPDTSTPTGQTDFISDHLSYNYNTDPNFAGINQYLAHAENLAPRTTFDAPSTHQFDIPLRSKPIPLEEVFLPVVNIHILADDDDTWIFSYSITFFFDNGYSFSADSDFNGITGVILNQSNRDYSGICVENLRNPFYSHDHPVTDMVLKQVKLILYTHHDKAGSTTFNVHIVNRLSATASQDIAIGANLLPGQAFPQDQTRTIVFSANSLPLASNSIRLQDMVLPQVFINIGPTGGGQWIFDYQISYFFASPSNPANWWTGQYETDGIILNNVVHKHSSVYQGEPFPTVAPLGKPQLGAAPHVPTDVNPKRISFNFLQKKLDAFINNRQGGSQYPPIRKLRLDNVGRANEDTLPESYYDLQSIQAYPPAPGTLSPPGFNETVHYSPGPVSLHQLYKVSFGDSYLNNINSQALLATVDPSSPTPLVLEVDFDCSGANEVIGGGSVSVSGMDLSSFKIRIHLTLTRDNQLNGRVDLLSWVTDLDTIKPTGALKPQGIEVSGQFLGKTVTFYASPVGIESQIAKFKTSLIGTVIDVRVSGSGLTGSFGDTVRDQIFSTLTKKGKFDGLTARDKLNSTANSWFLGGVLSSDTDINGNPYTNACSVNKVSIEQGAQDSFLVIDFNRPPTGFNPAVPANWPPPNFTPGTLANIDHIIVLTMENRSFDHMLGYLSLPPAKGGMGRTDVDGLKGGESNIANGVTCLSKPFAPQDTIIHPDPPHETEPVIRAINGGKMDGFAQAYCDESGIEVAPRIMQYHTAANVPVYDALARDFAICNRWFASHPGPTFCNRFHELTGKLNIDPDGFWETDNSSPLRAVFTPTIFDYLNQYGVSWKYFESFYCFLRFFQAHTFNTTNIVSYDDPGLGFVNVARSGALPSVTFIDPHFIELPPDGNCDGPPADVQKGQQLVQQVVEAVVTSPQWSKTLLIVTYDEHGGFYDHVPPPAATRNSPESLGTYGVRVPTFLISPWVKGGTVFGHDGLVATGGGGGQDNTGVLSPAPVAAGTTPAGQPSVVNQIALYFDHTSILKTIARRFMSQKPPYMGARYAAANDLSAVLGSTLPQPQFLPFIRYNLMFNGSQRVLDVPGGSPTPGALLWQWDKNGTPAQDFSFEDAGNGLVYIRSHCGNLYVTVHVPDPTNTTGPAPAANQGSGIKHDVKYAQGGGISALSPVNPSLQKWKLSPTGSAVLNKNFCTITSALFPKKVLEPSSLTQNGALVVLGEPAPGGAVIDLRYVWHITSPLLPSGDVVEAHS